MERALFGPGCNVQRHKLRKRDDACALRRARAPASWANTEVVGHLL
jgi:hypothetical protein